MKFSTLAPLLAILGYALAQGPCYNQFVAPLSLICLSSSHSTFQTVPCLTTYRADPDNGIGNYCYCEGDSKSFAPISCFEGGQGEEVFVLMGMQALVTLLARTALATPREMRLPALDED